MITIPDKVLDACDKDMLFLYSVIKRKQGKSAYLVTSCSELSSAIGISKSTLWRILKKMSKLGVCETANETANETAKGLRIYTNTQGVTKNRTPKYETANETANETAKKPSIATQAREIFEAKYKELHDNPYYWEPKDAAAMKKLIAKIKFSRENRDTPLPTDDKSLLTALGMFLDCIDDQWICEHYSVTVIASKYNEIIKNVRNKRNGANKQSKEERIRTDLANAAETFARLDAERVANLGRSHTEEIW